MAALGKRAGLSMITRIEQDFPGLRGTGYQVTSPQDDKYNCIAWAANDTTVWWWPDEPDNSDSPFWPPGVTRAETLEAFTEAFTTLGYRVCGDVQLELRFEKIALFAVGGVPTHAARQLANGRWTSKLGPMEDIEHVLADLTGVRYGTVVQLMKRPLPTLLGHDS